MKKGIGLPEYGIIKQDGPPHEPIFTTFCRVQDHHSVATSRSKKKGKELVAREVIMRLKMGEFWETLTTVRRLKCTIVCRKSGFIQGNAC